MESNEKTEKVLWFFEKCGPCIIGTVGGILAVWGVLVYNISQEAFDKVLESTITLSSILIGFVGVLLGILFTVKDTEAISSLFKSKKKFVLKKYFKYNIIFGMLLVLLSLLLYIVEVMDDLSITVKYGVYGFWGFLLLYTLSSTFRIINIIMHIIFDDKINENKEPQAVKMGKIEKDSLKQRYSK